MFDYGAFTAAIGFDSRPANLRRHFFADFISLLAQGVEMIA